MNQQNRKFGPEVLLVFVGHSEDTDAEARAVLALQPELQSVLDQHLEVANGSLPFKTVRFWEWNRDAAAAIGGQDQVITPVVDRANIAVFLFKDRIGEVTWSELERVRARGKSAPQVLAFFPASPPDAKRLMDPTVVDGWCELLRKKRLLTSDWTATDSRSLRPMDEFTDAEHLRELVLEQLRGAFAALLRPRSATAPTLSGPVVAAPPSSFMARQEHLSYDGQPVLAHAPDELDRALLVAFVAQPLSQEALMGARGPGATRAPILEQLQTLGCISNSRPNLGTFLCFAPQQLLADKFDGCGVQLVAYSGTTRGSSRASIKAMRGNLLGLFDMSMAWLTGASGLRRRGRPGSSDRDELEIPEIVLREVLANALVHRDYETQTAKDQPTRVEVYSDRVEVTSFGNLPQTIALESLNSEPERLVPYRRNPVIARIFQHMSHVELNASGVSRMHIEMERIALPPPRFSVDLHESIVRVVLSRPSHWSELTHEDDTQQLDGRIRTAVISAGRVTHRHVADQACIDVGLRPGFRKSSLDVVLHEIASADVFVCIVAFHYGSVPDGQEFSVQELQYRHAVQHRIPCLMFLMSEDQERRRGNIDPDLRRQTKLRAFKERIRAEQRVSTFTTSADLQEQLRAKLEPFRSPREQPRKTPPGREPLLLTNTLVPTEPLIGREAELEVLTGWSTGHDSEYGSRMLCIVGLPGAGKTALAATWFREMAARTFDERIWWNCEGLGDTLDDFVKHSLALIDGDDIDKVAGLPSDELDRRLLRALDRRRILLVLDGCESLFLHPRTGADSSSGKLWQLSAETRAGKLLRGLTRVTASRVLLTSRGFPADLESPAGDPVAGSARLALSGLSDAAAIQVLQGHGVVGGAANLLSGANAMENHPLALKLLAANVMTYRRAPGDIERWFQDRPMFESHLDPRIRASARDILQTQLQGMSAQELLVLRTMAGLHQALRYAELVAELVSSEQFATETLLDEALTALERRGLIQWDKSANTYHVHTLVRAAIADLT